MRVVEDLSEWRSLRRNVLSKSKAVGFVPTMGNFHEGHLSLIERAREENESCVVSIFVNPTQFDRTDDLQSYPRTLEMDLEVAKRSGVDFVLCPGADDIYADDFRYVISENELSKHFCGAFRPGHFEGVLTVVMKLLMLVRPHRAYFGEKDYQQLRLIQGMVEAFFLEVEIVSCPLIRAEDGLALSSRNRNLTAEQRKLARLFPQILRESASSEEATQRLLKAGFEVDYVADFEGRRLAAVHLGPIRLIDNVAYS